MFYDGFAQSRWDTAACPATVALNASWLSHFHTGPMDCTRSRQCAVDPAAPRSTVCSTPLAAGSTVAFSKFAATTLECLGNNLFIAALDQQCVLQGWGRVPVFIFSS